MVGRAATPLSRGKPPASGRGFFVGHRERRASGCRMDESNQKGRTVTIKTKARPSRRSFLKASAGTAALFAAAKTSFFAGVHGAAAAGPETTKAKLGFIALTDAGPLFVAKDKGFFAKHGMPDVEVQKQASWGTTRDNLVLGSEGNGVDGAPFRDALLKKKASGKAIKAAMTFPGGTHDLWIRYWLAAGGIDPDRDIE